MHSHTKNTEHITIVARGTVRVNDNIHKEGTVIDFEEGQPHEIEGLEDNSRIVNIRKYHEANI